VSVAWPWIALAGLGAFHGLNPAMGWLFAVARGLQRGSRAVVLQSMLPIAAGHALSIAMIVAVIGLLSALVDSRMLHWGAGAVLIAFGLYRLIARHRGRAGMQVGPGQLVLWSFLMATAHGAGLMLVPVLLEMQPAMAQDSAAMMHGGAAHAAAMAAAGTTAQAALAAVGVHTLAMLAVATAAAVIVYDWLGLAFLRRGWINIDVLWVAALIGAGTMLLFIA
jgi:hypothetical protein